eukprot:TRINITY_DN4500_c0_g1_i1.p1 TRINITY_DN4500_c0_g1~~TRINITY_DN4500_c0_g1_i1.p1  ORF type:complete len:641 (-),score=167.67 TRINITY_DN4500_c0_g1_i1:127-1908(-)
MDDDWLSVDFPSTSSASKSSLPSIHRVLCEQEEFRIVHRLLILDVLYDEDSEDRHIRGSGFISEPVQAASVEEFINLKAYFVWIPHSTMQMSEENEDEKGRIRRKDALDEDALRDKKYEEIFDVHDLVSIRFRKRRATFVLENGKTCLPLRFPRGTFHSFLQALSKYISVTRSSKDSELYLCSKQSKLQKAAHAFKIDDYVKDLVQETSGHLFSAFQKTTKGLFSMVTGVAKPRRRKMKAPVDEQGDGALSVTQMDANKEEIDLDGIESLRQIWDITLLSDFISERESLPPISLETWKSWVADGKQDKSIMLAQIFHRGLSMEARKDAWPYLLEMYSWGSSEEEKASKEKELRDSYQVIKSQWSSMSPVQIERNSHFQDRKSRIEKDVVRTDRDHASFREDDAPLLEAMRAILMSHVFYNYDIGYCQGMSDLLSPILLVLEDEAIAFWGFSHVMDVAQRNFQHDQMGVQAQLSFLSTLVRKMHPVFYDYLDKVGASNFFFSFRWILVMFKREISLEDCMKLWEALWTKHLDKEFHLYIFAGIIISLSTIIMEYRMTFDEILHMVSELRGKFDVRDLLLLGEATFLKAQQIIKK